MFRDIREWFELRFCVIALIVIRLAAIYWLIVIAARYFTREPLLYRYSPDTYTQETVPVLGLLFVQVIALLYQLVKRLFLGTAADSIILLNSSPKIAAGSGVVLGFWVWSGPAPGAHYVPLVLLVAVSVLGALGVRRGPFARDAARRQVALAADVAAEADNVARASMPTRTFRDIHGHEELKIRLLNVAADVLAQEAKGGQHSARNGILLHGAAGNGKTVFAEALAGELRLPLLTLTYAEVASRWVGEKTSRVRAAFQEAIRERACVFFIDEIDSFLESRDAVGPGTVKEDRDLVNALLTLMVDIRRFNVVLVAATNHLDRLDAAAVREGRFDFKIEIPAPDFAARVGLLCDALRTHLPHVDVPVTILEAVARRWNGYSTKRLLSIVEELPSVLSRAGRIDPTFADFMVALRAVQGHAAARLDDVRQIRDLVLSDRTRRGLENACARMRDPERTESYGGTLPTGIVFFGPPGTGKTAAAKGMAHELGWTFLAVTGAELSRDLEALNRLYAKAQELRPALIFIDEADELLRHRDYSAATATTNKLLTILDGAGERVRDVVWIAATNHMDQVDPALLRGGRFSEKIAFDLPTYRAVVAHVESWLQTRKVALEATFEVAALVELIGDCSIADVEAVLQTAVNLALGRGSVPVQLTGLDVVHAVELVIGSDAHRAGI
jgi:transitional endoplasmic reticulum ATPase